ncbi:LysR family transcriptional regulator [Anoxynatronum buryatiense]|nr:LysR family transcriptional regulator [Anoxynatronum buryatiense]
MDIFSMKCFLSVARYQNLSMAAKEVFISQPAMSQKINMMEKEMGVKLLKRSRHKVEMTEAGKLVQEKFTQIVADYENVMIQAQKLHAEGKNHLAIGYHGPVEWANIHQRIREFHQQYPDIEVDVHIGGWGQLTQMLLGGRIDVFFSEKREIEEIATIESVYLFRDYSAVAVSKTNPLNQYQMVAPESLNGQKIVMSNNSDAEKTLRAINIGLTEAGLDMENAKFVDKYETGIAMASAGMGVTPIPRSFKIKGHESVAYVDIDSERMYLDFVLAWQKGNDNPNIHLYKEFCQKQDWTSSEK